MRFYKKDSISVIGNCELLRAIVTAIVINRDLQKSCTFLFCTLDYDGIIDFIRDSVKSSTQRERFILKVFFSLFPK